MISLGLISGPKDSELELKCRKYMALFERERKAFDDQFLINIVFHSPLSLRKADFSGMLKGAFSRSKQKILIAIAVESEVVTRDSELIQEYIVSSIHAAVSYAAVRLEEESISIMPDVYHRFVDETLSKHTSS